MDDGGESRRPPVVRLRLSTDEYVDVYAAACDAAFRRIEADFFDREWDDPYLHTSDQARRMASDVLAAAGVVPEDPRG